MGLVQDLIATFKARDHFGRGILSGKSIKECRTPNGKFNFKIPLMLSATLSPDQIFLTTVSRLLFTITSKTSANRSLLSAKLAASSPSKASRSGSLPPNRHSSSSTSPNTSFNTSFNSSSSTANLTRSELYARDLYNRMSYVLVSTEDFHCGPSKISTIDPYLHEKLPFNIIKDTLYFQVRKTRPHSRSDIPYPIIAFPLTPPRPNRNMIHTVVSGSFGWKMPQFVC